MKYILVSFIVSVILPVEANAKGDIRINKDMEFIHLENHLLQWISLSDQSNPKKILELPEKSFNTRNNPYLQTPYFTASVWGKYRINVADLPSEELYLLISRSFHINLECYLVNIGNDSIIELTREPFLFGNSFPNFKLPLKKNNTYDLLIHINNKGSIGFHPISLLSKDKIYERFLQRSYFNGIFYGIMLLVLILTTLLSLKIKQKVIVFYSLYLLCTCLYQYTFDGYVYAFLFPDNPELNPILISILINLSFYFGIKLFDSFLQIQHEGIKVRKIGRIISNYFLIAIPFAFFEQTNYYLIYINNFTACAGIAFLSISSAYFFKKIAFTKYFLMGYSFLCIGIISQILSNIGYGGQENFFSYSLKFGLALEFLFLAGGLINLWLALIRENNRKALTAVEKLHESKMLFLSNRLNPHFIFNALSSIQNFVLTEDSVKASRYISKFSKLLRNIFDNSSQSMVSLEKELEHLKLYISMESVRTNDEFSYSTNIDSNINASSTMIPTMIFQPIVENAIWHGIRDMGIQGKIDLEIKIIEDFLEIKIRDNGIGRIQASKKRGNAKHKSGGLHLTGQRINIHNNWSENFDSIEIKDLTDDYKNPKGTEIKFLLKWIS